MTIITQGYLGTASKVLTEGYDIGVPAVPVQISGTVTKRPNITGSVTKRAGLTGSVVRVE